MYQRQEIVIKKNAELMARYDEAFSYFCNHDVDEEAYMREQFTENDMTLINMTKNANSFLSVEVEYYLDILKLLNGFLYKDPAFLKSDEMPYVTFKMERQENEDEIRVIIDEYWNNHFEQRCVNPLMEDNMSISIDYDEVPKIVRLLYQATQRHEYLQNQYAENREEFGECLIYNCIGRYFDEVTNGEGTIGVFNHETNKYEKYGYGTANNGWSGNIMTGHIVDKSVLEQNPDKLWYATNPMICWLPLGSVNEEKYPGAEYVDDLRRFLEIIGDQYGFNSYGGGAMEYEDGTENEDEFVIYYLKDYEDQDNTPLTSAEILNLLNKLEQANRVFIEIQKKSCERNGLNYVNYANDGFTSNLLFFSNNYEILYISVEESLDKNDLKTGELTLHCKKF